MKNWILYINCLVIVFTLSCTKQGYTPPSEGEKVPYEDGIKQTLKESLAESPAKLFYQAWQHSNMDEILKTAGNNKSEFTILAPSDEALENGGYNLQKLQSMDRKELDSLLMFYTIRDRITAKQLAEKQDNYIALSLRNRQPIIIGALLGNAQPYYYRHHLQLKDGKTYVNGKVSGSGKLTLAKDGSILYLDQLIARPEKTIMQVVESDERFSLLLQILQRTDEQYNQIIKDATGFGGNRTPFSIRFGWRLGGGRPNQLFLTTLFLPTNDAFKAAGFNSLADLEQFNLRRGLPKYIRNSQGSMEMTGDFATDSLLNYHADWGKIFITERSRYQLKPFSANVPVFYSNVMANSILSTYVITGAVHPGDPSLPDNEYYMPLDFSRDASGNILVKVKGAEALPAKIVEADIYTIMGPIHAVDHLLLPKGFKLN
jgi:uncharacterized surface protein with fasciclin (FAS1) repeats